MAERFIGVEAFKDFIRKDYCTICDCSIEYPECLPLCGLEGLLELIDEAPTIEAKPVVHAYWKKVREGLHICSNCKVKASLTSDEYDYMEDLSDYCPSCGAQMDEVIE